MVGFSAFVSIGSMLDVGWGDLIDYLGNDPHTRASSSTWRSIGDARAFLSAAREVALTKPIIVIKPGRTAAAAKAAASHTGSLTGSDEVLDAAFRRSGVLRVNTIADLFYMAEVLAKQPRPKGPRLTIVTNAGGPGVLATDALITGGGELRRALAARPWKRSTPCCRPPGATTTRSTSSGDAGPERYAKALEIAAKDPEQRRPAGDPHAAGHDRSDADRRAAEAAAPSWKASRCWRAGWAAWTWRRARRSSTAPAFPPSPIPTPRRASSTTCGGTATTCAACTKRPSMPEDSADVDAATASWPRRSSRGARGEGRTILTEFESKQLLAAYGIPTVKTASPRRRTKPSSAADEIGYPVVLKLYSETITHKTDVGGVQLNLGDAEAVAQAFDAIRDLGRARRSGAQHFQGVTVQPMIKLKDGYELIIGSSLDPQFGPVLLFGTGGQLVEVFKDRALALPPLNTTLARRMMEQTKIYKALKGVRGRKPVDLAALETLLVRFSQLVVEQRWIKEIDINPLLASPDGLVALDARVVLHGPEVTADQLPKPAIRAYPTRYVAPWTMKDGDRSHHPARSARRTSR